jgi:hypothetical protein
LRDISGAIGDIQSVPLNHGTFISAKWFGSKEDSPRLCP